MSSSVVGFGGGNSGGYVVVPDSPVLTKISKEAKSNGDLILIQGASPTDKKVLLIPLIGKADTNLRAIPAGNIGLFREAPFLSSSGQSYISGLYIDNDKCLVCDDLDVAENRIWNFNVTYSTNPTSGSLANIYTLIAKGAWLWLFSEGVGNYQAMGVVIGDNSYSAYNRGKNTLCVGFIVVPVKHSAVLSYYLTGTSASLELWYSTGTLKTIDELYEE